MKTFTGKNLHKHMAVALKISQNNTAKTGKPIEMGNPPHTPKMLTAMFISMLTARPVQQSICIA